MFANGQVCAESKWLDMHKNSYVRSPVFVWKRNKELPRAMLWKIPDWLFVVTLDKYRKISGSRFLIFSLSLRFIYNFTWFCLSHGLCLVDYAFANGKLTFLYKRKLYLRGEMKVVSGENIAGKKIDTTNKSIFPHLFFATVNAMASDLCSVSTIQLQKSKLSFSDCFLSFKQTIMEWRENIVNFAEKEKFIDTFIFLCVGATGIFPGFRVPGGKFFCLFSILFLWHVRINSRNMIPTDSALPTVLITYPATFILASSTDFFQRGRTKIWL